MNETIELKAPKHKIENRKIAPNFGTLIDYFNVMKEDDEPVYQMLDMLPIPIEIFAPDGTTVYMNYALMDLTGIKDRSLLIGKYNLLQDPVCMDQLGYREDFLNFFKGEKGIANGFPMPIQDLVERNVINEKPFEKGIADLYFYPVMKDNKLLWVVCVFAVRNLYMGRPDVVRAQEYIETHWQEKFDPKALAKYVNMSVSQLYSIFKKHTDMTPGDYYRTQKVEHIKEKLADKNLSVKEVFAICGEDSRGAYAKIFKKLTGHSPAQYRENMKDE